jgi:hypothetical protein
VGPRRRRIMVEKSGKLQAAERGEVVDGYRLMSTIDNLDDLSQPRVIWQHADTRIVRVRPEGTGGFRFQYCLEVHDHQNAMNEPQWTLVNLDKDDDPVMIALCDVVDHLSSVHDPEWAGIYVTPNPLAIQALDTEFCKAHPLYPWERQEDTSVDR